MGVPPPTTTETKVAKATRLESVRVVAGEKKIGFVENERDLNKTKEEEEEKEEDFGLLFGGRERVRALFHRR